MNAYSESNKKVRENNKKNPCGLCEDIDCEGCEYFSKYQLRKEIKNGTEH